jgi:radical SAM superfamily enzyme
MYLDDCFCSLQGCLYCKDSIDGIEQSTKTSISSAFKDEKSLKINTWHPKLLFGFMTLE